MLLQNNLPHSSPKHQSLKRDKIFTIVIICMSRRVKQQVKISWNKKQCLQNATNGTEKNGQRMFISWLLSSKLVISKFKYLFYLKGSRLARWSQEPLQLPLKTGDNRSCDLLRKITGNEAEAKDEEYFHITWIGSWKMTFPFTTF